MPPTPPLLNTGPAPWRVWHLLIGVACWCASHAAGAADAASAPSGAAACPPVAQSPTAEQIQAAQRDARDRGFLWRVTKNGRSSYLFGTLHLGRLPWVFAGPRLREALANTDTLALEIDLTDPALLQNPPPAATAPMPMTDALRAAVAPVAAACVPEAALQKLNPLMQAITLTVLAARWEGLDASFAQEIVLATSARVQQRPIVSLESAQSQLAVLLPTGRPRRNACSTKPSNNWRRAARGRCCAASRRPGPTGACKRSRTTRSGASAPTRRRTASSCGASTTSATRRWSSASMRCTATASGCWWPWGRCT